MLASFLTAALMVLVSPAAVSATPLVTSTSPAAEYLDKRLGPCNVVIDFFQNGETFERSQCAAMTLKNCEKYAKGFVQPEANCPCNFSGGSWFCICEPTKQGVKGFLVGVEIISGEQTDKCANLGGAFQGQVDI